MTLRGGRVGARDRCDGCGGEVAFFLTGRFQWEHLDSERDRLCDMAGPVRPRVAALPPVRVHHPRVEVRDDMLGGSPLVRGTRVPVRRLWQWHMRGVSVETLVKRYPSLGWANVLCALAFAYDNTDVVEADLARERACMNGPG